MIAELLAWLQALPQPALVAAAGLLVLGETTIGLGFLVPGETGLLVAATTATTPGRFLVLWSVVTVCAIAGDSIGYAVGRRYGARLGDTTAVHRHGRVAWDRACTALRRHGVWAVLVARFLPVVRTLTPAAAGAAGLGRRRFVPAVVVGAAVWSAVHVGLGAALGEAAERAERVLGTGGAVVLAVAAAGAATWVVRRRRSGPGPDVAGSANGPAVPRPAEPIAVHPELSRTGRRTGR